MLKKPDSIEAVVLELYKSGLSTRKIASKLDVCKTSIARITKGLRTRQEANILARPAKSNHWRSARASSRKLWIRNNHSIPSTVHIHHKDGDYTNRSLDNLEPLDEVVHAHEHRPYNSIPRWLRPERQAYMKKYLSEYRKLNVV